MKCPHCKNKGDKQLLHASEVINKISKEEEYIDCKNCYADYKIDFKKPNNN